MVKPPIIICYTPGTRGNFFAGLLFGDTVQMGLECTYINLSPNKIVHDLDFEKVKTRYPKHSIVHIAVDHSGFFLAQYIMWHKLLWDSPKTYSEILLDTISEVEFWYNKYASTRHTAHLADYVIDFYKTTDFDYICSVYKEITGNYVSELQEKQILQYLFCQPDYSLNITDCLDPCKVAVTIAKFKIENQLDQPQWIIKDEITEHTPLPKLQSLLSIDKWR